MAQYNYTPHIIPNNEQERLDALYSYQLFNEIDKEKYQTIVDLASSICETPIALISLVDAEKQVFKAKKGIEINETPREISFCSHSFSTPHQPFIVEDAKQDDRFANNPLVHHAPNIVFYAGVPLLSENELPIGTLCVIDSKPKTLTKLQLSSLKTLSKQVMLLFEQRKNRLELEEKKRLLEQTVKNLDNIAVMIAHDLKSAFRRISITTEILQLKHEEDFDKESKDFLNNIIQETEDATSFTTAILKLVKSVHTYNEIRSEINLQELIENICKKLDIHANCDIIVPNETIFITAPKSALQHVFENLIQNSIKYTDKDCPKIIVDYSRKEHSHHIHIIDDGIGIDEKYQESIFEIFNRGPFDSSEATSGSGIGLVIVNKIINLLGGTITASSNDQGGATFQIILPIEH